MRKSKSIFEENEIEEVTSTTNIICPYCGKKHDINETDSTEEDQLIDYKCKKCKKVFCYEAFIFVMFCSSRKGKDA